MAQEEEQATLDQLVARLPAAIQAGLDALLQWLLLFSPLSDRFGLRHPKAHVAQLLTSAGYQRLARAGSDKAIRTDARACAQYILGRAIDDLMSGLHVPEEFVEYWYGIYRRLAEGKLVPGQEVRQAGCFRIVGTMGRETAEQWLKDVGYSDVPLDDEIVVVVSIDQTAERESILALVPGEGLNYTVLHREVAAQLAKLRLNLALEGDAAAADELYRRLRQVPLKGNLRSAAESALARVGLRTLADVFAEVTAAELLSRQVNNFGPKSLAEVTALAQRQGVVVRGTSWVQGVSEKVLRQLHIM